MLATTSLLCFLPSALLITANVPLKREKGRTGKAEIALQERGRPSPPNGERTTSTPTFGGETELFASTLGQLDNVKQAKSSNSIQSLSFKRIGKESLFSENSLAVDTL